MNAARATHAKFLVDPHDFGDRGLAGRDIRRPFDEAYGAVGALLEANPAAYALFGNDFRGNLRMLGHFAFP